jgi:multiple sugar transport system ATP-binding protein
MASITFKNVGKIYQGKDYAVRDFNMEIADEEFIVLVGPSGCGKSTTLRMLAGLEEITEGELYLGDRLINGVEPKDRDIAMVFQNYALYPHMNVYDNMAFGLKLRKVPKDEIDRRVKEAALILNLTELLNRKPKALSGGQRQRVALGRAIVRNPAVFLMDEPLSNLDAKLRVSMRAEILKLHHRLKTTFVYVTHDQTEAMTMGTRIVVMRDGLMQQTDTPMNLYNQPVNRFVAEFIGSPQMNLGKSRLRRDGRDVFIRLWGTELRIDPERAAKICEEAFEKEVFAGIRPEHLHIEKSGESYESLDCVVEVSEQTGADLFVTAQPKGTDQSVNARVSSASTPGFGDSIGLWIDTSKLYLFDAETENALINY